MQLHCHDGFCRKLADFIQVNQAQLHLFGTELLFLIYAVLYRANDILGLFQNLNHAGSCAGFKADAVHFFLDIRQAEGNVLINGHIRPKRVVLEQETDFTLVRRDVDAALRVKHRHTVNGNPAAGRRFKTGNHAQSRRFSASGRTQQRNESVILNDHAEVIDRVKLTPALGDIGQFNP